MPPFNPATNAFFQPYPIFQGNSGVDVAIYPDGFGTYYPSQNKIRISQNCPAFMYVNLRPSSLVTQYYPGLDGNVSNQAKFILTTTGGQEISFLNEDIRSSHDPNFVRIDRICKVSSGEHIVFCHLEFENDSQTAPREIEVSFGLPVQAIKNCFEILEWNLGGQSVYGDFTFNTNSKKVVCTFDLTRPNTPSIQKCDSPLDEPQCSGYINFSYKMDKDYPVWEPETKIFVEKPIVKFDSLDFKVTKFEDLIDVKFTHNTYISSRPISTSHCSTNCNH